MSRLVVETVIRAPRERVFDLARSVEAHAATASFTHERIVAPGRLSGLLEAGDLVTFEAVHLGVRQRLTARIVELKRPVRFVDEAVSSVFVQLRHEHEFLEEGDGTRMRDTLVWVSPLGALGKVADAWFVARHLRSFLVRKQGRLWELAESAAD